MYEHVPAQTYHARRGGPRNAFRYGVDFVLTDFGSGRPRVLSRTGANLFSIRDRHHGGDRGAGQGLPWFQEALAARGFAAEGAEYYLLTQPSFLWFHFNPVSFWIAVVDGTPRAFIAEVNNTFGERHCYFCAKPDFAPIAYADTLLATKVMHVSPFQEVAGRYRFNFEMDERAFNIRITYENGDKGVVATLSGLRAPATSASLMRAAVRRAFGAVRVLGLIHWQALKLWAKGARYRAKPEPPTPLVTDGGPAQEQPS